MEIISKFFLLEVKLDGLLTHDFKEVRERIITMEIGRLHRNRQLYWILYPSEETATPSEEVHEKGPATSGFELARFYVGLWGKKLNCNVSIIDPASIFMVLEQNNKFCRILTAEGVAGWIQLQDWCKNDIEEAYGSR